MWITREGLNRLRRNQDQFASLLALSDRTPNMATLMQPLAMAIGAIMAKMAIIAIMAMANGGINTAMLGIQSKSNNKPATWSWSHLNRLIHSTVIALYVILTSFVSDLHCKIADIRKVAATRGHTRENCLPYTFQPVRPQYNEFH